MKILIIEAYSSANIGSGALVENSVKLLKDNFPESHIEILAQHPKSIRELTQLPTHHELISLPLGKSRLLQIFWLIKTCIWMFVHSICMMLDKVGINIPPKLYTYDSKTLNAIIQIRQADMVVSVGAERINDNFYKAIYFSLYMLWIVKCYKKMLVLFPQTIGPFYFKTSKILCKKVLSMCDVIYLRDKKSRENIDMLHVQGPTIIDTCDVAVLQDSISAADAEQLLNKFNIPTDKPLVGISAMKWTYIKASGKSGYDEYSRSIAEVADFMIEKYNVNIVFLATNILIDGCREDDVSASRDIIALMKHKKRAGIISDVCSPSEMKGIMGELEMCIVTRMHACIFSTGIFTPTVSINYQFKLHEYMKLVGLGNYTIDIDKVSYESLEQIVCRGWDNREKNREVLRDKIVAWSEDLESKMRMLPNLYKINCDRTHK